MKNRILGAFVSLLAGITAALTGGIPAHASYTECLVGYFCFSNRSNWVGSPSQWTAGYVWQQSNHDMVLPNGVSDTASAVRNRTGSVIGIYNWSTCTGASLLIYPDETHDFETGGTGDDYMNNIASCMKVWN